MAVLTMRVSRITRKTFLGRTKEASVASPSVKLSGKFYRVFPVISRVFPVISRVFPVISRVFPVICDVEIQYCVLDSAITKLQSAQVHLAVRHLLCLHSIEDIHDYFLGFAMVLAA